MVRIIMDCTSLFLLGQVPGSLYGLFSHSYKTIFLCPGIQNASLAYAMVDGGGDSGGGVGGGSYLA